MRTFAVRMTGIKNSVDLTDGAGDHVVGIGIQPNIGRLADVDHGQIVLVDIADDPHLGEIGDGEGGRRSRDK